MNNIRIILTVEMTSSRTCLLLQGFEGNRKKGASFRNVFTSRYPRGNVFTSRYPKGNTWVLTRGTVQYKWMKIRLQFFA